MARGGEKKKRSQVVRELLEKVEAGIDSKALKVTLADYIRLMQLHRELEAEEPKEIRVSWVEPEESGK